MACVVYGCKSRCSKKSEDDPRLSFHRFPQDEQLKNIWVKAIHRENWKPTQNSRICSKHFTNDCYMEGRTKRFLRRTAIPTVFENYPTYIQKESTKLARDNIIDLRRNTSCLLRQRQLATDLQPSTSKEVCKPVHTLSEPSDGDTPRKRKLKKILAKQLKLSASRLKRLKSLQKKCRKFKRRILSLENVLSELKSKSMIDDECAQLLSNIGIENQDGVV